MYDDRIARDISQPEGSRTKWKVDIFFSSGFRSARVRARTSRGLISNVVTRWRARDRSPFTAVQANVTVHKSMVTRLNTAWIYRARLSPCVMINYDDRMTATGLEATRGVTIRACVHRVTCNMGCRVVFGVSIDGERRTLLLYVRRLLADCQYGLSV